MHSLSQFVLLYTRCELPGWGKLLKKIGGMDKESVGKWYPKGNVSVRGKWNKYSMLLDTSNVYDRSMFLVLLPS